MSTYFHVIRQAVFYFPLAAALLTLPYILFNYRKYGSILSIRVVVVYSFVLYLMCAYFLVILPLPSREAVAAMTGDRTQLELFHFLRDIAEESARVSYGGLKGLFYNKAFRQFVFNILMLVPFGMYLRYYFRCGLFKTVFLTFLLSLFFELTQLSGLYFIYPRSYRLFDVDDLLANTLGGFMGYLLVWPFLGILPTREEMDRTSYRRGQRVSALRRLTAFLLDLAGSGLVCGMLYLVMRKKDISLPPAVYPAVIWLCFSAVTALSGGGSLGKFMTRLKIVDAGGERAHAGQYFIRYFFLFLVLMLLPALGGGFLPSSLGNVLSFDISLFTGRAFLIWIYGIFWLYCLILMILHKPVFYEKLSHTRVVSTVKKHRV